MGSRQLRRRCDPIAHTSRSVVKVEVMLLHVNVCVRVTVSVSVSVNVNTPVDLLFTYA